MQIDIATTATRRPDLYAQTLKSFAPLFAQHDDWRLVLHIDPIGPGTDEEMVAVAEQALPHTPILFNCAATSDFRKAWHWCAANLVNEYALWLEDDWELLRDVDLAQMLKVLHTNPALATLRLPRWEAKEDGVFRQWNRKCLRGWNGSYLPLPAGALGYSNNPCLVSREFLQYMLPIIVRKTLCPEKQINGYNPSCKAWTRLWDYGLFQHPGESAAVRDIGEAWRKVHGYGKGDKMHFSTWKVRNGSGSPAGA